MPDVTQPTEQYDAISQETVDAAKAAAADPSVREALARPSLQSGVAVIQDPQVQAAFNVVPEVIKETKAGYKTTEFWVTVAALVGVNLNGVVLTLPDKYQAVATSVIAIGYALARGLAKKGIPAVEPGVPEA